MTTFKLGLVDLGENISAINHNVLAASNNELPTPSKDSSNDLQSGTGSKLKNALTHALNRKIPKKLSIQADPNKLIEIPMQNASVKPSVFSLDTKTVRTATTSSTTDVKTKGINFSVFRAIRKFKNKTDTMKMKTCKLDLPSAPRFDHLQKE